MIHRLSIYQSWISLKNLGKIHEVFNITIYELSNTMGHLCIAQYSYRTMGPTIKFCCGLTPLWVYGAMSSLLHFCLWTNRGKWCCLFGYFTQDLRRRTYCYIMSSSLFYLKCKMMKTQDLFLLHLIFLVTFVFVFLNFRKWRRHTSTEIWRGPEVWAPLWLLCWQSQHCPRWAPPSNCTHVSHWCYQGWWNRVPSSRGELMFSPLWGLAQLPSDIICW